MKISQKEEMILEKLAEKIGRKAKDFTVSLQEEFQNRSAEFCQKLTDHNATQSECLAEQKALQAKKILSLKEGLNLKQ